ncbi:hypothetical protein TB2_008844 [Malus domestica]
MELISAVGTRLLVHVEPARDARWVIDMRARHPNELTRNPTGQLLQTYTARTQVVVSPFEKSLCPQFLNHNAHGAIRVCQFPGHGFDLGG